MLNKEQKKQVVAELHDKFSRATGMVLTNYKGMTVAQVTEMRADFRAKGVEYRVVKNTLARIATEGTPAESAKDSFVGPIGVAIGYDDAAAVAKSVLDYTKKNDKLQVTCAVVDGTFCEPSKLKAIADLPSRDVLLGILAGTMQAPASQLARLLSATVTQLGYALNALREKKAA